MISRGYEVSRSPFFSVSVNGKVIDYYNGKGYHKPLYRVTLYDVCASHERGETVKSLRGMQIVLTLVPLLVLAGFVNAYGQNPANAVVLYTRGHAEVKFKTSTDFVRLVKGTHLGVGDTIKTGDQTKVELKLGDESKVVIGPNGRVVIKDLNVVEVTKVSTSVFELLEGKIRAIVTPFAGRGSHFNVETSNATVGVRGTDFGVIHDPGAGITHLLAVEGTVYLTLTYFPDVPPIPVMGGEEITVSGDSRPPNPSNAVGFTVYDFLQEMMIQRGGGGSHNGGNGGVHEGSNEGDHSESLNY